MTLAPRVQVYTQLSCNAIYGHDVFNHTLAEPTISSYSAPHPPATISADMSGALPRALHSPAYPSQSPEAGSVIIPFDSQDDDEPDPRSPPSKRCLGDPAVQSRAASLQTIMTTVMGVLSAITTGWWGNFGENHGRTRVLAISTLGLFMT